MASDNENDFVRQDSSIQISDPLKNGGGETLSDKARSSNHSELTREARRYERNALQIPVLVQVNGDTVFCRSQDMTPGGLRILSRTAVSSGTPLELKFRFGDVCYLNIAGRVVFCLSDGAANGREMEIGITFSALRDWEQMVLLSAFKELKESAVTREKSVLTIVVSMDRLAVEASRLGSGPRRGSETRIGSPQSSLLGSLPYPLPTEPTRAPLSTAFPPETSYREARPEQEDTILDINLPTFTLLVNGEDLDTHLYKYVFYADKFIVDPPRMINVMRKMRSGQIPPDFKDYVFAKYCVGRNDTNATAMQAAHDASQEFRHFSLSKRLKIMTDIYDLLVANKERLIELMVIEGHPRQLAEWEFLGMEQAYRKQSLDFYRRHLTIRIPSEGTEALYLMRKPDGVVAVCPPRNAPCSSSLIAGFALLAGNTLIVKPPLQTPVSTIFLWKHIVHKALKSNNAPPGTLNLVVGNSEVIIDEWLSSHYVNDLLFIGDSSTGLQIGNRAFSSGKKPILELSGNDLMFVWKDADLDQSVQSLLDGFLGSTQICMVPKKAFIHEDIFAAFEATFLDAVKNLRVGLPSDPDVCLSPVVKIGEFYDFLTDALDKGAELLCGGMRVNHRGIVDQHGSFLTPAVIRIPDTAKAHEMRCVREENFFPLIPLIKVSSRDTKTGKSARDMAAFKTMVHIANGNAYGLRVSVWVKSRFYIQRFMEQIQNSGLLRINCRHIGFSPCLATHGGRGKSGGPFGELNYVWQKTTHLQGIALARPTKSTE